MVVFKSLTDRASLSSQGIAILISPKETKTLSSCPSLWLHGFTLSKSITAISRILGEVDHRTIALISAITVSTVYIGK